MGNPVESSSFSVSIVEVAIILTMLGLAAGLAAAGLVVYRRSGERIPRAAARGAIAGGAVVLATLLIGGAVSAPASVLLFLIIGELSLLGAAFWVWMLVDCALNEPVMGNDRLIWVLIILFAQVVGATLYLLVRRPQRFAMAQSLRGGTT